MALLVVVVVIKNFCKEYTLKTRFLLIRQKFQAWNETFLQPLNILFGSITKSLYACINRRNTCEWIINTYSICRCIGTGILNRFDQYIYAIPTIRTNLLDGDLYVQFLFIAALQLELHLDCGRVDCGIDSTAFYFSS